MEVEGDCQRHGAGNLYGVGYFKSPPGYSGEARMALYPPEADGNPGLERGE